MKMKITLANDRVIYAEVSADEMAKVADWLECEHADTGWTLKLNHLAQVAQIEQAAS